MSPEPDILVIEDNEDNRDLADYLLRAGGYAPRLAAGGVEGLKMALEEPPDLILLDLRMPEMDGYEVAAALNGRSELALTRIVAFTASAMVEDRKRIADAGFDGYIQKPIESEAFVEQVRRFLTAPLTPGEML
jgi:two-component system cell cycle response regulator